MTIFIFKWWWFADGRWHAENEKGKAIASGDTYRELFDLLPDGITKFVTCHSSQSYLPQHPFQDAGEKGENAV